MPRDNGAEPGAEHPGLGARAENDLPQSHKIKGPKRNFGDAAELEESRIAARDALRCIVYQLAAENRRVRRVDDHHPVKQFRALAREQPGRHAAPVMPDENGRATG